MTSVHLFRIILPVADIDAAEKFYSHVLDDSGERVSPGRHYFDCNGTILTCYSPTADGDELGQGWLLHENQYLYFSVDDLDRLRARITAAGGELLTEIETMPWGESLFYATDSLGNRLSFVKNDTLFTGSSS